MGTVPTPYSATAGTKLSASGFNAGVTAPLIWAQGGGGLPILDAYNASGIVCANSTAVLMPWDTEIVDTDSMHSTSSIPGRVVINTAGRYDIQLFCTFGTGLTLSSFDLNIRKNANESSSGGTSIRTFSYGTSGGASRQQSPHLSYVFSAGDQFNWFVTQSSGGSQTTVAAGLYCTGIQVRWIGTV